MDQPTYDKIGNQYNTTRQADPYLSKVMYEYLSQSGNGPFLEIGCGTGNYTRALHDRGLEIMGVDPSELMLATANANHPHITFQKGTAEEPGLPQNYFRGILAMLTIHHWTDLAKGFQALDQICQLGARMVIFTSTPSQMDGYWLNHYFPEMLKQSKIQMPTLERVLEGMANTRFELEETQPYSIAQDLKDLFLYNGKHDPEIYFNPQIRHGISSFSALAHQPEVAAGLAALRADIDSGKMADIIQSYKNDKGDYLFLKFRIPTH